MKLHFERGKTTTLENLPPRSIALDGYVQGPAIDSDMERYSFDHHDKCVRLVTSATCAQVLDALLLGLDPTDFTVFVNDVDEDTVLSVWLLQNPTRAHEEKVERLVHAIGKFDAHGLAFPVRDQALNDTFRRIVMAPVAKLRVTGTLQEADIGALLTDCVALVDEALLAPETLTPVRESPWELLHTGTGGWVLYSSRFKVYPQLYRAGITKAIWAEPLPNGSTNYTVMKMSDLVPGFPVGPGSRAGTILYALHCIEEGWGGSSTIGGAPRHEDGRRSSLNPKEVFDIVERVLKG